MVVVEIGTAVVDALAREVVEVAFATSVFGGAVVVVGCENTMTTSKMPTQNRWCIDME